MNTLTPYCQVKIALILHDNTVLTGARGQKEIESLIKVITEHLTRGLEITLNPHWPISSSEDQLVNPYDLLAVNAKYMFTLFRTAPSISLHCLGQRTNCTPSCF